MKRTACILIFVMASTGCASMSIQPISASKVAAWEGENGPKGYVVYHPLLALEISEKRECADDKDCKNPVYSCSAGKPFYMPDFTKPYEITSKAGLGKAGMDVSIVDGWQLSSAKDSSDNTAFLSAISTIFKPSGLDGGGKRCDTQGLYTLDAAGNWKLLQKY